MVDESIKELLREKHGELNFNGLLAFMEDSGIDFKARKMTWPMGLATFFCIYIDLARLSGYSDKFTFFVILHEIAHYKRMLKTGKEHLLNMLSLEDFDEFCADIINEEIIADRYGALMYHYFNKETYPKSYTQQLHLPSKQTAYASTARELFGVIKHSEENYLTLLNTFLL